MQTAIPFRAWRYTPEAGELSDLIAPPYDVIDPPMQSRLYARQPHNIVRVDFGVTTPSDNDCDNQYTRAATQLATWKESGLLKRDESPSFTFAEESFAGPDGVPGVRHGFLGLIRLHEFKERVVFPHELTISGPKDDRFSLMKTTEMSLSPVFLLYDLPGDEITSAWRAGPGTRDPAAEVADSNGNVTRIWPTSDALVMEMISRKLADARFIIADGHHRYETALRYRQDRRKWRADQPETGGKLTSEESEEPPAYEFALAYFSNIADPGLAIYATHRLVAGIDPQVLVDLPRLLAPTFAVERLTHGAAPSVISGEGAGLRASHKDHAARETEAAQAAISAFLKAHPRGAFGFWGPELGGPYGILLSDQEAAGAAAPGHSAAYQGLDVTILHRLILEQILKIGLGIGAPASGAASEPTSHVAYVTDIKDAFARLEGGEFQAGFFMNPTGLDQVQQVALEDERMPPKATYFYPKLPTGLVFHDLGGHL